MNFKLPNIIYFAIIFIFSALQLIWFFGEPANSYSGSKSAQFIALGFGARQLAMSGAFTAVDNDIYSAFWNPAGLASLSNTKVAFMHNSLPLDINQEYMAFGFQLKNLEANKKKYPPYIAISLNYGKYGRESVTDYAHPYGTGNYFGGSDLMLGLSFADKLNDNLLSGLTAKFIRQKLYDYSGTAFALDIGMIYRLNETLSIGSGLFNAGSKIKFIEEEEELPFQFKTGVAFKALNSLLTTGDIIYSKDEGWDFAAGLELRVLNPLALRAGFNSINDASRGITLGIGLNFPTFNFDYAYEPYGEFENSHKISMDYTFGKPAAAGESSVNILGEQLKTTANLQSQLDTLLKEGYLLALEGNYFSALMKFNEAKQLAAHNILARLWLAYTHAKLGNIPAAIREYEQVLQLAPENINALRALKILKKN